MFLRWRWCHTGEGAGFYKAKRFLSAAKRNESTPEIGRDARVHCTTSHVLHGAWSTSLRRCAASWLPGLLLVCPFRCRWPAFLLFLAASPYGLCPVAGGQSSIGMRFILFLNHRMQQARTRWMLKLPECQAPEGIGLLGRRQCSSGSEETRGRPPVVGFRSCSGAPFACRTRGPRGPAVNPWWWCGRSA
jgi:hypothetical protein